MVDLQHHARAAISFRRKPGKVAGRGEPRPVPVLPRVNFNMFFLQLLHLYFSFPDEL